ncbi:hypothetical protein NLJ89_g11614 [Agrocybe chaxingu]|uniref:Uncharacterized protein n=1 Tax=Agrocybe chaxingu TaxID=84603 RepID=A0A9W8JS09_9AGAR|nr:hypothetical protein NLJ89_g11614 [Agrocybe chaxingu]
MNSRKPCVVFGRRAVGAAHTFVVRTKVAALYIPMRSSTVQLTHVPTLVLRKGSFFPVVDTVFGAEHTFPTSRLLLKLPAHPTHAFIVYYRHARAMKFNRALLALRDTLLWRGDAIVFQLDPQGRLVDFTPSEDFRASVLQGIMDLIESSSTTGAPTGAVNVPHGAEFRRQDWLRKFGDDLLQPPTVTEIVVSLIIALLLFPFLPL